MIVLSLLTYYPSPKEMISRYSSMFLLVILLNFFPSPIKWLTAIFFSQVTIQAIQRQAHIRDVLSTTQNQFKYFLLYKI